MTDDHARLALVTGGGRGYGATVAKRLAEEGFTVAVLGRDQSALEVVAEATGGVAVHADVLDAARIDQAIQELLADYGAIDVLVNNAGVGGPLGPAWEVDLNDWWRTFEVNVHGTHIVTRAVLPGMLARRQGRIINVVSNAGVARWPLGSAYAVSKAALIKYGENLAAEVRRHDVIVLNFHPGILEIGLTETLFAADAQPGTYEAMIANWFRKQISEGRSIDAEESASQLVRLAEGIADALTGRYLTAYDDIEEIAANAVNITDTDYTLGLLRKL